MSIRIQETTDYSLLAELNEPVQMLHYSLYPDVFKPYDRSAVETFFVSLFREKEVGAFLAKRNETVMGYVIAIITDLPENPFQHARRYVELDQLLVLEDHRQQGVGKELLDAVVAFAREHGINRIQLNHWTMNAEARSFFNANGFSYCREVMYKEL